MYDLRPIILLSGPRFPLLQNEVDELGERKCPRLPVGCVHRQEPGGDGDTRGHGLSPASEPQAEFTTVGVFKATRLRPLLHLHCGQSGSRASGSLTAASPQGRGSVLLRGLGPQLPLQPCRFAAGPRGRDPRSLCVSLSRVFFQFKPG